jgi:hypothetical protein
MILCFYRQEHSRPIFFLVPFSSQHLAQTLHTWMKVLIVSIQIHYLIIFIQMGTNKLKPTLSYYSYVSVRPIHSPIKQSHQQDIEVYF